MRLIFLTYFFFSYIYVLDAQSNPEKVHFSKKKEGSKIKMNNFFSKKGKPSFKGSAPKDAFNSELKNKKPLTKDGFKAEKTKKAKLKDSFASKPKSKGGDLNDGFAVEHTKKADLKDSFLSTPRESNANNEGNFFGSNKSESLADNEGNFFSGKGKRRERKTFIGENGKLKLTLFAKKEKKRKADSDAFTLSKKSEKRMRDDREKKKNETGLFQPGVMKKK